MGASAEGERLPRSALLLEVPEAEPLVMRWRAEHDPSAKLGVPAHITVLYPFLPPGSLPRALPRLRRTISRLEAPQFVLDGVDRFPGALWLRPTPASGLIKLTESLWRAYPRCPPYGGQYAEVRPHLTIAMGSPEELEELAAPVAQSVSEGLPVRCSPTAISLFTCDALGRWRRRAGLPLAVGRLRLRAARSAQPTNR